MRGGGDLQRAQHADDREPNGHDGPEYPADLAGAAVLHGEQAHDDRTGDRHHVGLQFGCGHLQPLHGGQHRHGGRDDPVAEEQAGADDPDHGQHGPAPSVRHRALRQRHEREDAALALVVGAHDQHHVFQGDDDDQRPEDERKDAEDLAFGNPDAGEVVQARLERVERAGADIAIHDAEDRQQGAGSDGAASDPAGGGNDSHGTTPIANGSG